MNHKYYATALFTLLASSPLQAAEYSYEGKLNLGRTSLDPEAGTNTSDPLIRSKNAEFTYFLSPVESGEGPVGEAAFLRHASSVTLAAALENYESKDSDPADEEEIDATHYDIAVRKVFSRDTDWVVEGMLGRGKVEIEDATGQNEKLDTDLTVFSVSRYVQPHTEIGITRSVLQLEEDQANGETGEIKQTSVWGKTVRALEDGAFFSLWGEVGKQDANIDAFLASFANNPNLDEGDFEGSFYKVGAAYFPNALIELGAEMTRSASSVLLTSSIGIGDGFSAWAEYFVSPRASVALSLSRHTIDLLDEEFDIDTVAIEGRYRFQ